MRPSMLPALAQCPKYTPSTSDFAADGSDRHRALTNYFGGDESALDFLTDEEAEGVKWAVEYIRLKAPLLDHPIQFETKDSILLPDFTEIEGTPDAVCGGHLFDLKWREFDYSAQMACYALMRLQNVPGLESVRVHVLYAAFKRAEVYEVDEADCLKVIGSILARSKDPLAAENPCSYCGWCAKKLSCPALNERAQAIALGREDWKLEQYHASEITKPEEMAKALALATQIGKWVEAVKFYALEMAVKQGVTIPGYTLATGKNTRTCTDLNAAMSLLGMAPEEFVKCCSLRWGTSKKDPAKPGVENLYKDLNGIPLAAAKREIKSKLESITTVTTGRQILKPIKSTEEESEE